MIDTDDFITADIVNDAEELISTACLKYKGFLFILWVPEYRWRKTHETKDRKQNNSKQDQTTIGQKQLYKYSALWHLQKGPCKEGLNYFFLSPYLLGVKICGLVPLKVLKSKITSVRVIVIPFRVLTWKIWEEVHLSQLIWYLIRAEKNCSYMKQNSGTF